MMFTARQLEQLHKAAGGKGPLVLPYRARLTPMASDWVRSKSVAIGYSDASAAKPAEKEKPAAAPVAKSGDYLWWCDGPCGQIKAAIAMEARQAGLRAIDPPASPCPLTASIKTIAEQVKAGNAAGGVLVVESSATAVVLANRSPVLRAIVGTHLATVEQGVNAVAANVLILEHPRLSLAQARNLLSRFLRGERKPSEEAKRQIAELSV
jgi:ribose 5-phosphate isomerase RpiB